MRRFVLMATLVLLLVPATVQAFTLGPVRWFNHLGAYHELSNDIEKAGKQYRFEYIGKAVYQQAFVRANWFQYATDNWDTTQYQYKVTPGYHIGKGFSVECQWQRDRNPRGVKEDSFRVGLGVEF